MEPAYDCYSPQVKLAGGKAVPVVMPLKERATSSADYRLDVDAIRKAITSKTKVGMGDNFTSEVILWWLFETGEYV